MKIFSFFPCLIFVLITNNVFAQTSANATLNVVLSDVRSIKINPAQSVVNLNFTTANDYANGINVSQNRHIEITSTSGFIVKVKASGNNLTNGTNTIPVNTITLTPFLNTASMQRTMVASGSSFANSVYTFPITLSPTPKLLVESSYGSTQIFFDINYASSGGASYMNKVSGTYSTTITYTIEPD
jgi:hypothetical protein